MTDFECCPITLSTWDETMAKDRIVVLVGGVQRFYNIVALYEWCNSSGYTDPCTRLKFTKAQRRKIRKKLELSSKHISENLRQYMNRFCTGISNNNLTKVRSDMLELLLSPENDGEEFTDDDDQKSVEEKMLTKVDFAHIFQDFNVTKQMLKSTEDNALKLFDTPHYKNMFSGLDIGSLVTNVLEK